MLMLKIVPIKKNSAAKENIVSQILKDFDAAVAKYIRPATYPVVLRMMRKGESVPEGYQKPSRDLGERIGICQGVSFSRRLGIRVVMQGEDQACGPAQIVMGFADPPEFWSDGRFNFEGSRTATLQAGRVMAESVHRFQPGQYDGLLSAPLQTTDFEPDMVVVYCNTLQATLLINAARYMDGEPLRSVISARFACADAIVQTMLTGQCHLALPCGGDRRMAFAQTDEVIFTAPVDKIEGILMGWEKVYGRVDTLFPSPVGMKAWLGLQVPAKQPEKYQQLAKLVGVD